MRTRKLVVALVPLLCTLHALAIAGSGIAADWKPAEPENLTCDELALSAGFDSMTDYFCPREGTTLEVTSARETRKGVWLGPSYRGVMLFKDAHLTSDDSRLERLTEQPLNLGVISRLNDEQDAARYLSSGPGSGTESAATVPVKLRDCACGRCRYPDADFRQCVRASCQWWCCACIVDYI